MVKSILVRATAITALLLLSACGWHLRGKIDLPEAMRQVHLQTENIGAEQERDIQLAFKLNKISLVTADEANYIVRIFSVDKERRVNSLGTDGVADSIALSLTADFDITDSQGVEVIERGPSRVARSYNFDRDNVAAKAQEEQTIERELRQELAQQILRSFRFALRNQSQTPATTPSETVPQESLDEQTAPGATE
ncbi:LPS assembly lipoprotein LptE [Halioxenophilus aromaticivorans]|uniref:LPS-assembly lipoprotein LptE n=1 Tax=Halioxenophilus aromaticivorans TaxID=1306992 RepID=A0AAV3U2Z9_9ALTE